MCGHWLGPRPGRLGRGTGFTVKALGRRSKSWDGGQGQGPKVKVKGRRSKAEGKGQGPKDKVKTGGAGALGAGGSPANSFGRSRADPPAPFGSRTCVQRSRS